MHNKEFFELYKKIGLSGHDVSAEISMIKDYLNISPLKELQTGGITDAEKKLILKIITQRIETQKPLQQILGFGYFMGEKFKVNEYTLIPRPETELLVRECTKLISNKSKVLDIGTGTGCIAIEIAKISGAEVDGIDISEHAVMTAKENAKRHGAKCNFFVSDLFSNINKKYDLIVSNPPYIPIRQKNTLSLTVKNFEPHNALFAKDIYGIEFYEKIINQSVTFLNKNGYLAFELGKGQYNYVRELFLRQNFSNIKIFKDLDNIERVTITQYFKKNSFQDNV